MVILITRLGPLLRKYAGLLHEEDAFDDLVADFIQKFYEMRSDTFHGRADGEIFNYLKAAVKSLFEERRRNQMKHVREIVFTALSDAELLDVERLAAESDIYFRDTLLSPLDLLTPKQKALLILRYEKNWPVAKIAAKASVSPSTVNRMEKRALHNLGQALAADERRKHS